MLLEVKKPTTAKRQHFERKWRYLQRLLSRQKTTGFQAAEDNLGPLQQTEEHEILQPRKALVQTQIDVEKVRRYQTFEFIFQAWRCKLQVLICSPFFVFLLYRLFFLRLIT